jgi:hypothetical protein
MYYDPRMNLINPAPIFFDNLSHRLPRAENDHVVFLSSRTTTRLLFSQDTKAVATYAHSASRQVYSASPKEELFGATRRGTPLIDHSPQYQVAVMRKC